MAVKGVHHFNLQVCAAELLALTSFYCDVIGLRAGPRPPFRAAGVWLYAAETPLLHITQMNSGEVAAPDSPAALPAVPDRRSAFDHIALACDDFDATVRRLDAHGIGYTLTEVPLTGETQLFCTDPSGVGIELIFPLKTAAEPD
jgi:catechol 2,3-dioxygenase-like lactoylglutathione lyase family enzyme